MGALVDGDAVGKAEGTPVGAALGDSLAATEGATVEQGTSRSPKYGIDAR